MTIFISYRRDDSRHIADRMYDRLSTAFGRDGVFKDVDYIPLGSDFRRILQDAVSRCEVLFAVIGNRWVSIADAGGQRRLDNSDDFVRIEVESALQRGIPVIPILVDGASFPQATELPPSLQELSFRNGTVVRPDPDFHRDLDRLIKACQRHTASRNGHPLRPPVEGNSQIDETARAASPFPASSERLQYLLLHASNHASSAWFYAKTVEGAGKEQYGDELLRVVDSMWPPAAKIVSVLAGWQAKKVQFGRPRLSGWANHIATRNFEGEAEVRIAEWQSFSALIHFRDYQLHRDIDTGYLDFYFMPSSDPHAVEWAQIDDSEAVNKRLSRLRSELKEPLREMASILLHDHRVGLTVQEPFWCKDCVPALGGDAYWIKGLVQ